MPEITAGMRRNGKAKTTRFYCKSKGVKRIARQGLCEQIAKTLREGYDVLLDDQLLIRVALIDHGKKAVPNVTVKRGTVLHEALKDAKITIVRGKDGEEISRAEVDNFVEAEDARRSRFYAGGNAALDGRVNVSPDMTVTCPKCGTVIRVGKKLQ